YLYKYIINNTSLINDKIEIATSTSYDFGSLQLASDGKIYMANYLQNQPIESLNRISVINNPNDTIDNDFELLSIHLGSDSSFKGLPNFVQSYVENQIITENKCVDNIFSFSVNAYATVDAVFWEFGDGTTSTEINPTHQYSSVGTFNVKATIVINDRSIELYKEVETYPIPVLNPGEVLGQCDTDSDGIAFFNLNDIESQIINASGNDQLLFYHTYNDALQDTNRIPNPEAYENQINPETIYVTLISPEGCSSINDFTLEATQATLGGIPPMVTCEDSDNVVGNSLGVFDLRVKLQEIRSQFNIPESASISFYATLQDAQTQTNPLNSRFVSETTTIWVRITDENAECFGIESISLTVNSEIATTVQETYTLCFPFEESSIILDGGSTNDSWEWSNATGEVFSSQQTVEITQPGMYQVTLYKTENGLLCTRTIPITVNQAETPSFNEVDINNQQIFVSVSGNSNYEFSLNNESFFGNGTSYTFTGILHGIYTLYVRDKLGCEVPIETPVDFVGYPSFFSPNGDNYNDIWKIHGLSPDLYSKASITIYDRYGKTLHSMNLNQNNEKGWNGLYNGELLITSDYWFKAVITRKDNSTYIKTGHFSL